jgi:hypothetical protein
MMLSCNVSYTSYDLVLSCNISYTSDDNTTPSAQQHLPCVSHTTPHHQHTSTYLLSQWCGVGVRRIWYVTRQHDHMPYMICDKTRSSYAVYDMWQDKIIICRIWYVTRQDKIIIHGAALIYSQWCGVGVRRIWYVTRQDHHTWSCTYVLSNLTIATASEGLEERRQHMI